MNVTPSKVVTMNVDGFNIAAETINGDNYYTTRGARNVSICIFADDYSNGWFYQTGKSPAKFCANLVELAAKSKAAAAIVEFITA